MYLISIYFDNESNKILNRHIKKIAEKTGNTFMEDHNVPPHLTISSIEARSVDVLRAPFLSLKNTLQAGALSFASIGQLLPYVMYAAPVLNQYLQNLSENVYAAVKDVPETTVSKYYKPYSFMPHVTLAKTLSKEQMKTAFSVMQESFIPFEAKVVAIGLDKINPHETVEYIRLDE